MDELMYNDTTTAYDYGNNDTGYSAYPEKEYGYDAGSDYESDPYGYGASDPYAAEGGYAAKKEYGEDFYYGAMSVAVLTLGLVVLVEFILHRIDMSAIGKPFNQAVLDAVYRELAVLGIVELGIHIMQQYYDYDKDKKAIFADVHFLLFYTDIFNALQAVIQAYATQRVSQRLWVRTEELELDHYVEIREEYDRVHKELYGVPPVDSGFEGEKKRGGWANSVQNMILRPNLRLKYKELLLQVRFHELRVYFLQAYKLPLKLKVSDYLMRSENNVMISLVHISPAAWLWLTAICNVLYFLAGMIVEVTGDSNDSATFYSIVFFIGMVVFVIASMLMDKHMELIFHRIMKRKHLWAFHDDDEIKEEDEDLAAEQRSLFFLGDPKLVVTIIQFMQFGYAIALSVVAVYWKDMQKDVEFSVWPYVISSVLCYVLFIYNMSRVIPRYTLCTNLGQLVDKELLRETVAMHKLKEEEKKRTHNMDNDNEFYFHMGGSDGGTVNSNTSDDPLAEVDVDKISKELLCKDTDTTSTGSPTSVNSVSNRPSLSETASGGVSTMDLINMDTASLREVSKKQRRSNRKAMSEGVSLMRRMTIEEETGEEDEQPTLRNDRKKSFSNGVDLMQFDEEPSRPAPSRELMLADLVKMDTQSVRNVLQSSGNLSEDLKVSSKRVTRRKCNSAGVSEMKSMRDISQSSIPEFVNDSAGRSQRTKSSSSGAMIQEMRMGDSNSVPAAVHKPVTSPMKNDAAAIVSKPAFDSSDDGSIALSEVDDAPLSERHHDVEEHHAPVSLHARLCAFFISSRYRFSCHVFGTMICFFIVAMRVEGFLQKQCIIPEADSSWDLPLQWTFFLETVWLLGALAASLVLLLTFMGKLVWDRNDWTTVISAIFNVSLVSLCLGLLFQSEAQRCCGDYDTDYEDAGYKSEGEASDLYYDSRFLQYGAEKVCKDETLLCDCAAFGYRVSGGLGSIEPWTALIALQAFRFIVARYIAKWYNLGEEDHHHHAHHGHGHGHGHGHPAGPEAIANAWQEAVAKHPELVEKYGEFSGEVLQAMLGLEIAQRRSNVPALTDGVSKEKGAMVVSGQQGAPVMLEDEQYNGLSPEVQEIIAAGKVGMPVKLTNRTLAAAPMAPLEFEVDTQQARVESLQLTTTFEFPTARIIRSVRRCDRMFLPLLKKWTAVDVILTNHEIVYVDVNDVDGSIEDQKKRGASNQALAATKGGRGLRLCDITAGRRIVGHLSLSDITAVYVDRELHKPKNDKWGKTIVDVDMEASKIQQPAQECWQPNGDEFFDGSLMAERWEAVPQDKLNIVTNHGNLFLRFYSDLKESELNRDQLLNDENETLQKDTAFQWAQTLVRMCVNQLKQSLPHFGENDSEELRDYLHMVSC